MADLITLAVAKDYLGGSPNNTSNLTLSSDESATLALIITSISRAAEKFARRTFASTAYDEIHEITSPDYKPFVILKEFPIITLTRVRTNLHSLLEIQQTDTTTNQYATAQAISTGIKLTRTASGATTTTTAGLDYAGNVTIAALVTAINAIGSSWTARATNPYSTWPSLDLYCSGLQTSPTNVLGAYGALGAHTQVEQAIVRPNTGSGEVQIGPILAPYTWHPAFTWWAQTTRIEYTAGYATIPEDLQQAVAAWVAACFWETKRDPMIVNSFATAAGQNFDKPFALMPPETRQIISLYKRRSV